MKLMTPPMASVPYSAEAPSRSTSTRSSAAKGIMFRSGIEPSSALLAMRQPFSSTSVLLPPMPRKSANDAPPLPEPTPCAVDVSEVLNGRFWITCSTLPTPCCLRSSMRYTVTGTAVSASMRLIAEPVTSTRCGSVAWPRAAIGNPRAVQASNRAAATGVLGVVNMVELPSQW